MSASLDIGLLGPLVVRRGGKEVRIAAPKQRALVALLALQAGRAVSTDELVDKLWAGHPPDSAATAVARSADAGAIPRRSSGGRAHGVSGRPNRLGGRTRDRPKPCACGT